MSPGRMVMEGIKREETGRITAKLHECRMHLQKDNVYSCLLVFRDVIEKMRTTKMLPADEKLLKKDINAFQQELASAKAFRKLYGPVTFMDDDLETTHDFMKQLIQIKEEEIIAEMEKASEEEAAAREAEDIQKRIDKIRVFVERGEYESARNMAEKDEEAADELIEIYNAEGIQHRKDTDFDKSVLTFEKALAVRPSDECLYYNMARTHVEASRWEPAKSAIAEALRIRPDFPEGENLLVHINKSIRQGLPA
jgi:tetratricopeptide (TPR) repeat protein